MDAAAKLRSDRPVVVVLSPKRHWHPDEYDTHWEPSEFVGLGDPVEIYDIESDGGHSTT